MELAVLDRVKNRFEQQDYMLFEAVKRLKDGDNSAFTNVYKLSQRYIYSIIYNIIKNDEVVADLMQDTYLIIYKNINSLKETRSFLQWAGCIATREAYRHIRKYKREVLISEEDEEVSFFDNIREDKDEFLPEELLINNEKKQLIFNIIDQLSDEQKITVQYYYYSDMSVTEIAEEMNCPPGTVKSRLNYARKQIKDAILDLEKKHKTKLYGTAAVPIIWLLFRERAEAAQLPKALSEGVLTNLSKSIAKETSILKEASNIKDNSKLIERTTLKKSSNLNPKNLTGLKKLWKTSLGKTAIIGTAVIVPAAAVLITANSLKVNTVDTLAEDEKISNTEYSDDGNIPLHSNEVLKENNRNEEFEGVITVAKLQDTGFSGNFISKGDFYYDEYLIKGKYIKINKDGLVGLIDIEGNTIIDCQWDDITIDDNTGTLIKVRNDGKYGYLNPEGDLITGKLWDDVGSLTQDNIFVAEDFEEQKFYYFDIHGNMITDSVYEIAKDFKSGIAIAQKNGKWGVFDKEGNIIVDFLWDGIYYEGDNPYILAETTDYREEYSTYCFDLQGKEIFKIESPFQATRGFNNGVAVLTGGALDTEYYNYIDTAGNILYSHSSETRPYQDGVAVLYDYWNTGYYMLVDKNGNRLTKDNFTYIYDILDETAIVEFNDKYGAISTDSSYIITADYDQIKRAEVMKSFVCTKDNMVTVIDYDGKTLIELTEGDISIEGNNTYMLKNENGETYYDSSGQLLFMTDSNSDYDIAGYDDGHVLKKYYDHNEIADYEGNVILTLEGECYLLKRGYFVQIIDNDLYLNKYEN